jgi:hypothetical protein
MLGIISTILLAISLYQTIRYGFSGLLYGLLAIVGFLLGVTVFSKMNKVVWDEEKEVIANGRMDKVGFAIIGLYIIFEMGLRHFLKTEFAGTLAATTYLLATIGASLLGRTLGTMIAIQKVVKNETTAS